MLSVLAGRCCQLRTMMTSLTLKLPHSENRHTYMHIYTYRYIVLILFDFFRSVLPVADYDDKRFPTPENRPEFFEHR